MKDANGRSEAVIEGMASSLERPSSLPSHSLQAHVNVCSTNIHVLQSDPARNCTRGRHEYDVSDGAGGPCSRSLRTFTTNVLRHVVCINSSPYKNAFP